MAGKNPDIRERKPRVDAERNRGLLLDAAKREFRRAGADASLEAIAKRAGVGAGTLYRHFPTRDDLIIAVYQSEVEKLAAAGSKLAESMPPLEALRAWMLLFIDHVAAKHIIAPALNSLAGGPAKLYEGTRPQMHGTVDALVKRAVKTGAARKDLRPEDLLWPLIAAAHLPYTPDWRENAGRLVETLIAGARANR